MENFCSLETGSCVYGNHLSFQNFILSYEQDSTDTIAFSTLLQRLSDENRQKQAKNIYVHCMSRGGYRMVEERLMQEDLKVYTFLRWNIK